MDTRIESNYGRNLIIRLGLLLVIGVLSYATPGSGVGLEPCESTVITLDFGEGTDEVEIQCGGCYHEAGDCWSGGCCVENDDGSYWGIDNDTGEVKRYNCGLDWTTCED